MALASGQVRDWGGPGDLIQETDEFRDYRANDVLIQRSKGVKDGKVADKAGIAAKDNVEHRTEAHVHLLAWVGRLGGPPSYLCGTFRLDKPTDCERPLLLSSTAERSDVHPLLRGGHRGSCHHLADHVEQSMLVKPVEFVKPPKGVILECRPAVIRLKPLDHCLSLGIDSGNLGHAAGRGRITRPGTFAPPLMKAGTPVPSIVPKDRKFRPLLDLIGERGSKRRRKFESQMVKRRAQTLEKIPDAERQALNVDWGTVDQGSVVARLVRIGFLPQGIEATFAPPFDLLFDVLEMCLRPAQLEFKTPAVCGVNH